VCEGTLNKDRASVLHDHLSVLNRAIHTTQTDVVAAICAVDVESRRP